MRERTPRRQEGRPAGPGRGLRALPVRLVGALAVCLPAVSLVPASTVAQQPATTAVSEKLRTALETKGIWAANPAMGFPMEMHRFPGKIWTVAHKPIAEAAG